MIDLFFVMEYNHSGIKKGFPMQINGNILIFFFSLIFFSALFTDDIVFADDTVFVSEKGNDTNSGITEQQPVKTLAKGLEIARQKHIKAVQINGRVFVPETLVLTPEDSSLVIFGGNGWGQSILDGGKIITGWQPYKDGIWQAKLPDGQFWKFRQIYVNNQHRHRARTPNTGYYRVAKVDATQSRWTATKEMEYKIGDIDPAWKNLTRGEITVYHFWNDVHLPIASVDGEKNLVTFQYPSGKILSDNFTSDGARYFVENIFETLDAEGEWYCDEDTAVLYYKPFENEDITKVEVVAPFADGLIRIQGDPASGKFVEQVFIGALQFQHCNFNFKDGDTNSSQASVTIPAAVTLSGAKNCSLDESVFRNLGCYAVAFLEGCQNNTIKGCHFWTLSAGGIKMTGGVQGTEPSLHTKNNKMTYCTVSNYGIDYPSAVGLLLQNISDCEFAYNEIHHGNYSGVSLGWTWGYGPSIARNNSIHHNHIHHIGLQEKLSDMGGIYTLGQASGSVLANNVIHDIAAYGYGGWGIYSDEGTTGLLIEKNIVYNTEYACYDMHYGRDVLIRNNIFVFGKKEQLNRTSGENHISLYFTNNIVYWKEGTLFAGDWKDREYKYHQTNRGDDVTYKTNFQSDWNLFYNPAEKVDDVKFYQQETFADWQKRGYDKNSLYTDPMFEEPGKYNFRLKPESPALKRGFEPIDTEGLLGL
ncbi:hypothetical protein FACS189419_05230 [Planctomycetales bacterium]|nr:hypothetical protein FACS189419_05230 [Planctomycetales bacterium]